MRWWCAVVLASTLGACAHRTCEDRAEEAYRLCVRPLTGSNPEELSQPRVAGDQAADCEVSRRQAMAACAGGPVAPVVDIRPDAGS